MTTEQKQKALQLLELCIDTKPDDANVFCTLHPRIDNIYVTVSFGGQPGSKADEVYDIWIAEESGERKLDEAIKAVSSIHERAQAAIAAKEAGRRAKIIKEYEELINK